MSRLEWCRQMHFFLGSLALLLDASKAALNMLIKTWAIELARTHAQTICVGMHPGTVESHLSKPFQKPTSRYFTPKHAANCLVDTAFSLRPEASGNIYAYDGTLIAP